MTERYFLQCQVQLDWFEDVEPLKGETSLFLAKFMAEILIRLVQFNIVGRIS